MRLALAALLLAACAPRTAAPKQPADAFGTFLGNYHVSRGPDDPTAPLAMDPDVTEGGGPISMAPRGPLPPDQVVTPTVGEQPDTLEQAKGPVTTNQQPAAVVAPSVGPVGATVTPVNPPGTPTTPAPATGTGTGTTTAPVQGPVTGAGPNGPGTGTGPATPTGPATGPATPTPTNPGPTTSTPPAPSQ